MHYKDGTKAKVGDLVKGLGYNIKGADGKPCVIVGKVMQLTPGADSCNCIILTTVSEKLDKMDSLFAHKASKSHLLLATAPGGISDPDNLEREHHAAHVYQEYGAIKDFELVHRQEA